jgi:hypothetical protein
LFVGIYGKGGGRKLLLFPPAEGSEGMPFVGALTLGIKSSSSSSSSYKNAGIPDFPPFD